VLLLVLLCAMFAAESAVGGTDDSLALFRLGSLFGPAVRDGDWWRLGSYAFLHVGVAHFAFNAWALWVLMRPVETTYGAVAAMGFFSATALSGAAASLAWAAWRGPLLVQAAGASGGIFGLFGTTAALFFRLRHRLAPEAVRGAARTLLVNLLINVALAVGAIAAGFPLDNAAHVGGFFAGIALGLVAPLAPLDRRPWHRPVLWGLALASFTLAAMEGIAVARAVRPHRRMLRVDGAEAAIPYYVVPVEEGIAASPAGVGFVVQLQRGSDLPEPGGGRVVRFGDMAWHETHVAEDGADMVVLVARLGDERLRVRAQCIDGSCTPEKRDELAEDVAAHVRLTSPPRAR
jgi:rhomboid protease GluP